MGQTGDTLKNAADAKFNVDFWPYIQDDDNLDCFKNTFKESSIFILKSEAIYSSLWLFVLLVAMTAVM